MTRLTTWRGFWLIIAFATAAAAVSWIGWALLGAAVAVVISLAAMAAYLFGVYRVIREGGFRRGLAAQFVVLGVAAITAAWLVGAMIALAFWGEPVGPPN